MPKERFHLLVADHVLSGLYPQHRSSTATAGQRLAYHLGAVSPDTLFYDLPSFRSSHAAAAMHRHEGPVGVAFLGSFIHDCEPQLTPDTGMWLLGVAVHLLTDGFWHPHIEKVASCHDGGSFPGRFKLSKRQAHHWLESEQEAFWLHRAGPAGGYRQMLRNIAAPGETLAACIHLFRLILRRLGTVDLPDAGRLGRCFSRQAFLLNQFSLPGWARSRNLLLKFPATRFWGTLIVPEKADRSSFSAPKTQADCPCRDAWRNLFSDQLMAQSLSFLKVHLPALAARL